jgi:SAM-dependent methyltransferase
VPTERPSRTWDQPPHRPPDPGTPRWFTHFADDHASWYVERFRAMAADGADLDGEARTVDALVEPGSRVLDAGCGQGRVGAALHARGHLVTGVDADARLIAAARATHPGPSWLVGDLADLDPALGRDSEPFDAIVLAGNVMVFLAPGSEQRVLRELHRRLTPDGVLVAGFSTSADYGLAAFDRDAAAAGFTLEHRFATWTLRPWHDAADWAVSVLRRPA